MKDVDLNLFHGLIHRKRMTKHVLVYTVHCSTTPNMSSNNLIYKKCIDTNLVLKHILSILILFGMNCIIIIHLVYLSLNYRNLV